jgi:hypothetical protein
LVLPRASLSCDVAGAAEQPSISTGNIHGLIQALPQFREVLGFFLLRHLEIKMKHVSR